jgi:DNA-binding response OmpR family regulator
LFRRLYDGGGGLALLEISPADAANPEKLLKPFTGLPGMLTVVFGASDKITPSQVARMIDLSADDFIPKNIDERILRSKLKAYLRRAMPSPNCARTEIRSKNGEVQIDKAKRLVRLYPGGGKEKQFNSLTPKEFEILYLLLSLEEQIVSRELLLNHIWGEKAAAVNSETVDKHVESLRKKLGPFGRQIQTVYGAGYVLKCA